MSECSGGEVFGLVGGWVCGVNCAWLGVKSLMANNALIFICSRCV